MNVFAYWITLSHGIEYVVKFAVMYHLQACGSASPGTSNKGDMSIKSLKTKMKPSKVSLIYIVIMSQ